MSGPDWPVGKVSGNGESAGWGSALARCYSTYQELSWEPVHGYSFSHGPAPLRVCLETHRSPCSCSTSPPARCNLGLDGQRRKRTRVTHARAHTRNTNTHITHTDPHKHALHTHIHALQMHITHALQTHTSPTLTRTSTHYTHTYTHF